MTANGCLSLFFAIALPDAIVDSWIQARTYQGICRECIEPLSDEAAQLLHVIARIDHAIDPLDGTRPHGVVLERHIVVHCSTMPNAWFRPIAKQAPLSGYYKRHNEGWIHWSTASSAFRTDEELLQYGIDHGTATFPDFPLPMRDQIIAWKVPIVQPWKCKWLMGHC